MSVAPATLSTIGTVSGAVSAGTGLYNALKPSNKYPEAITTNQVNNPITISNPYNTGPILTTKQSNLSSYLANPYEQKYMTSEGQVRGK